MDDSSGRLQSKSKNLLPQRGINRDAERTIFRTEPQCFFSGIADGRVNLCRRRIRDSLRPIDGAILRFDRPDFLILAIARARSRSES